MALRLQRLRRGTAIDLPALGTVDSHLDTQWWAVDATRMDVVREFSGLRKRRRCWLSPVDVGRRVTAQRRVEDRRQPDLDPQATITMA